MSYIPRLEYVFCVPRVYQLDWHVPLYRYMNTIGLRPRILVGDPDVPGYLNGHGIAYESLRELPERYDVFIPLTTGFMPFTRYWLEKSLARGKFNCWVLLTALPFRCEGEFICPTQTRFLHAMCVTDQLTIGIARTINNEVLMLNTGHPLWDNFGRPSFNTGVQEIRGRYGPRLLVVSIDHDIANDYLYAEQVTQVAQGLGFRVVVQAHPGIVDRVPASIRGLLNPGFDRYALFRAASHAICFVLSTMSSECLYLGTRLACKPLGIGPGCTNPGDYCWFSDIDQWYEYHRPLFDRRFLDAVAMVYDEATLVEFLRGDGSAIAHDHVRGLFGWPCVPCYSENVLRVIEQAYSRPETVDHAVRKTRAERGKTVDFSWKLEGPLSQFGGLSDASGLMRAATVLLKQGRIDAAGNCLRRAERFSGTEHFDFVQYAQALCQAMTGNLAEARKSIYRALFVNPSCPSYIELRDRINAHLACSSVAGS